MSYRGGLELRWVAIAIATTVGAFLLGRWNGGQHVVSEGKLHDAEVSRRCARPSERAEQTGVNADAFVANLMRANAESGEGKPEGEKPHDPVVPDSESYAQSVMARLMAVLPTPFRMRELPELRLPEVSPTARIQFVEPYVRGLADALRNGDPESLVQLADLATGTLCHPDVSENQAILITQLGRQVPAIISSKGIDCFLAKANGKEDMSLWALLDAWREGGHEKTPALAELERTASDARTKQRFLSSEQENQQRMEEVERARLARNGSPQPTVTERNPAAARRAALQ